MALLQPGQSPDFRTQRQDPFAAILNAYQQKAQMEQQAKQQEEALKQQKFSNILQAVQTGMGVAQQATQMATAAQQRNATNQLADTVKILSMRNQPISSIPMGPQNALPTMGQTQQFGQAQANAQAQAIRAGYGELAAQQLFPQPQQGQSHSRIEQRNIEIPGIGQMVVSIDPRGQVTTLDGKPVPPELLAKARPAYAPTTIQTEEGAKSVSRQGGVIATTKLSGGPIPISRQESVSDFNQLEPKSQERFTKLVDEAKSRPHLQTEVNTIQSMGRIRDGINAKNPAVDAKLGLMFQRALGDTGNIAVVEQAFPGSKQILDQGQRAYGLYIKNGLVNDKSRADLLAAVDVLEKASQNKLNSIIESESEGVWRQARQLDRGLIRESVGGSLYKPVVSENTTIKTLEQAKAMSPEMRRARIKQLEAQARKRK